MTPNETLPTMSEELIQHECHKALTCLYIAVPEDVADDVNRKVRRHINSLLDRLTFIEKVKSYVDQQCKTSDANSHEWQPDQASGITDINAAYRAGMWYAYRDVLNRLP